MIAASQGANMYCFGAQQNGAAKPVSTNILAPTLPANVDMANTQEDVSPAGTQAYGQSEESIAAKGLFVVGAWNDATGFFTNCGAQENKEELTGWGFSHNGGASFQDMGGLPNNLCDEGYYYDGDPSVEAYSRQGRTYFYISSLYNGFFETPSYIAMDACQVTGSGNSSLISCNNPTPVAQSSSCYDFGYGCFFYSFLDKDFLAIDQVRGRLYATYTDFGGYNVGTGGVDDIDLAVCNLNYNPAAPTCYNGSYGGFPNTSGSVYSAYFTINGPTSPVAYNGCEDEGAYPAVDPATGDVYVAYEHNWATNIFYSYCFNDPVQDVVAYIPFECLTLPAAGGTCGGNPENATSVLVTSLDAAFIPGYNRFPMNDFPRIAVSDPFNTVSIVWNDASLHPQGDILLQSWNLAVSEAWAANPVQVAAPMIVDRRGTSGAGWKFLPALRNASATGHVNVSFYSRSSGNTALTNTWAAVGVDPTSSASPANSRISNVTSDWNAVSSDIVPNFGDYTDNYVIATPTSPYTGLTLFVAWADGRLGVPNPFEAHVPTP
ncbi:MAG TPA: hypothetical protein VKT29_04925 [Terriglobales bacterium]|nr:hypothetical protein [Terriglobales bacterium]